MRIRLNVAVNDPHYNPEIQKRLNDHETSETSFCLQHYILSAHASLCPLLFSLSHPLYSLPASTAATVTKMRACEFLNL